MAIEDLWFEDALVPAEGQKADLVKSGEPGFETPEELAAATVGIVRIGKPRGLWLDKKFKLPISEKGSRFALVRLAFEFDIHPEFDRKATFVSARCETDLWPAQEGGAQPTAYAVLPDRLDEGGPTKVNVKVNPSLKLETVEASLGEVSFDLMVGMAQPVVVGWKGKDERAPYWKLTPKGKALIGEQDFWIVAEIPPGENALAISARASAQVEVPRFQLPWLLRLTTKSTARDERPRHVIQFG